MFPQVRAIIYFRNFLDFVLTIRATMGTVELSATNQGVHKNEHYIQHQEVGPYPERRCRHHRRFRDHAFILRVRTGVGNRFYPGSPGIRHHPGSCFQLSLRRSARSLSNSRFTGRSGPNGSDLLLLIKSVVMSLYKISK